MAKYEDIDSQLQELVAQRELTADRYGMRGFRLQFREHGLHQSELDYVDDFFTKQGEGLHGYLSEYLGVNPQDARVRPTIEIGSRDEIKRVYGVDPRVEGSGPSGALQKFKMENCQGLFIPERAKIIVDISSPHNRDGENLFESLAHELSHYSDYIEGRVHNTKIGQAAGLTLPTGLLYYAFAQTEERRARKNGQVGLSGYYV